MTTHTIKNHKTGASLFYGDFKSFKHCLEAAVRQNIDLSHANLRHARLRGANLDGARLNHTVLSGADCTGANLSEAALQGADLSHADLSLACLCDADMRGSNMYGASMFGTLMQGAHITGVRFSRPCALLLPFVDTYMGQNTYIDEATGTECSFSRPPLVVLGLPQRLVVFDTHIMLGHQFINIDPTKKHILPFGAYE